LITVGDLGGVSRIDIKTFCYSFTSKGLGDITKYCQGAYCVLSSVPAKALDDETILSVVQTCYGACPVAEQQTIVKEIQAAAHEQLAKMKAVAVD